jgi:hypothetical protein
VSHIDEVLKIALAPPDAPQTDPADASAPEMGPVQDGLAN